MWPTNFALAATVTGDAGTLAGSTTACSNTGGAWVNPTNAQTSNNSYATFGGGFFDNNEVSDALALSNFGFILPNGSTIDGFLAEIEGHSPDGAGTGEITLVRLTKTAGAGTGSDLEAGANPMNGTDPNSYADSYGAAANLWGTTWTEAEVEASGFGVTLCFMANGNNVDISIDHVRITVYYTPPTVISGLAYQSEGGSFVTSKTVQLYKNGSASLGSATTNGSGAWSVSSGSISSGDILTAYIDNDAINANTVFVSNGADQSDINLFGSALIVRHDTGSNITNANLSTGYVSSDSADMVYGVSGGNLTLNAGAELHVWAGDTYLPGGKFATAAAGNLHLDDNSTATIDTATSTIGDDITIDTGATLNINAHTEVLGGDITTAGTGLLNYSGTPRVSLYGSGTLGGGSNALNFYDLVAYDTGVITLDSTTTVAHNFEAGQKQWNLMTAYEPLAIGNTLFASSSTFSYQGNNATVTPATYYNLDISPNAGSPTFLLGTTTGQTIAVQNNFTISGAGNATVDVNTYDPILDIGGGLTIGAGDTFLASESSAFNLGGDFANSGTFNHNSGTLTLDTTNTSILTSSASMTFYNLTSLTPGKTILFQAHSSNVPTFTITNILTITGAQGNNINIRSNAPGNRWLVNFLTALNAVTYATLRDSGCAVGSLSVPNSITNSGEGNNGPCWNIGNTGAGGENVTIPETSVESGGGGGGLQTGGGEVAGIILDGMVDLGVEADTGDGIAQTGGNEGGGSEVIAGGGSGGSAP